MRRLTKFGAAIDAVEHGWYVFPAGANRKAPAGGLIDWERRATNDPAVVTRWWGRHPDRNVAVATGPSGLVVVDLDVRKPGQDPPAGRDDLAEVASGLDVLVALAEEHVQPMPPETYTVRTASGGWHLYFRAPEGVELRNTSGRIGWLIDTRAVGGYVIAAGSSVDGRDYRLTRDLPLPELPAWLHRLSAPPMPPPRPGSGAPIGLAASFQSYAGAAFAAELGRVYNASEGGRNWALNKAAWNLSRFIAGGHLDRLTVELELQAAAASVGLRPAEAAATVRSAIASGMRRHPRVVTS